MEYWCSDPSPTHQEGLALTLVAVAFYLCLFLTFRTAIQYKALKSLKNSFEVANWMTTIVQAAASTGVGLYVVTECIRSKIPDIVYGCRCSLVDRYIWIMVGYFIYDSVLIVMDGKATVRNAVVLHHVVLLAAVLPALLFLRSDGLGDAMIGVGFLAEASTPFVAIKNLLRIFQVEQSVLHIINLWALFVAYFLCRISSLPFLLTVYFKQGQFHSVAAFIWSIPIKCLVFTTLMMVFQLYWFTQIGSSLARKLTKWLSSNDERTIGKEQ